MTIDLNKVVLQIAERLREKATDQHRIPFRTGDLRKSIQTDLVGPGRATVGSSLPYARPVHDGRPAITIRPNVSKNPPLGDRKHRNKNKARLKFKVGGRIVFAKAVNQPARKGKPFLREAAEAVEAEGFGFLDRYLENEATKEM